MHFRPVQNCRHASLISDDSVKILITHLKAQFTGRKSENRIYFYAPCSICGVGSSSIILSWGDLKKPQMGLNLAACLWSRASFFDDLNHAAEIRSDQPALAQSIRLAILSNAFPSSSHAALSRGFLRSIALLYLYVCPTRFLNLRPLLSLILSIWTLFRYICK